MIYKAELDSIPIRVYIDLIDGKKVLFDVPFEQAKKKLMQEYMTIVGGKRLLFKVWQQNELMNLQARIELTNVADNLARLDKTKEAASILETIGYSVKENKESIDSKCKTLYATFTIKMDKLTSQLKNGDTNQNTNYREIFLGERVALLKHYKVHIDIDKVTAAEYAMLLRSMCTEIELNKKAMQNIKVK